MSEEVHGAFFCHVVILILILILIILFRGQVIDGLTDREVVLQLKHYLDYNNQIYKGQYAQWNESDSSPCNWQGITCNKAQRVTGIKLSSSDISGNLFSNFSLLTELTRLDLSMNTISGPITADLNNCTKLQYLNLSNNILEGELRVAGLINLLTLDVTQNRFQGEICLNFHTICANLVSLNLSGNNFTGKINKCFDQCPNLQFLDLSANQFSGALWLGFAYLKEFIASENGFTGEILSTAFPLGCNLKSLQLELNNLSGTFPNSIGNCSKLKVLNIRGNQFTGEIPQGIGMLSELEALVLGKNSFDRNIPDKLLNCTKLEFLDLTGNNFGGTIPTIFGNFTTLKYLVLRGNNYTGGIETSGILKLQNVTLLELSYNSFSGDLPHEFGALQKLTILILAYNKFSGSIPPQFGNILTLQTLDVSFNQLTGSIPPTIGNLTSLMWLMLANNNLTGPIPPEIGNCSSLLWLNAANNQLSGSIPPEISLIGRNPYPTFAKNRREITKVSGSSECLTIKRWLPSTYPPFNFIYVSRKYCQIAWEKMAQGDPIVPICLNSSRIRTPSIPGYIILYNNQLSGEVPADIGNLPNFALVHLDFNRFSGRLPASIAKLPLSTLKVSNNQFSGDIPETLGNLQCLEDLDLSMNNFSGVFPASFNHLFELTNFNISYNPLLSGTIPATGQLSTFDNDSFLGDPLIMFIDSLATKNTGVVPSTVSHNDKRRWLTAFLWVLLMFVYIVSTVLSFLYFNRM